MSFLTALILSLIQALTEFFPVSSSGHLAFFQSILPGVMEESLLFDLWLHLATAMAILVFYRKELRLFFSKESIIALTVTTGITGVIGLLLHDLAEQAFTTIPWVASNLLFTGLVLFAITRMKSPANRRITLMAAAIIGIAQGLAVFPGISRSGLTIVAALFVGIEREEAARYSFIAAVPVIALASGYEVVKSGVSLSDVSIPIFVTAFAVTFLAGLWALKLFIPMVKRLNLQGFSLYCIIVAGGMFIIHGIR